jgi:hypothetical protein
VTIAAGHAVPACIPGQQLRDHLEPRAAAAGNLVQRRADVPPDQRDPRGRRDVQDTERFSS